MLVTVGGGERARGGFGDLCHAAGPPPLPVTPLPEAEPFSLLAVAAR